MKVDILTLFPEMFSAMQESILGRAQKSGKIQNGLFPEYFFEIFIDCGNRRARI